MNEPKHPPLNTPLSAFTAAMLDALPVGSRFDEANTNGGVLEKCPDGWRWIDGSRCECIGFPDEYNGGRPLIRVGPEQASEPAPMYFYRITRDFTVERSTTGADPWSSCPNAEVPAATAALVMKARREAAELAQLRGHHTMIPTPPLPPGMTRALDRFSAHVEAQHGGPVGKSALTPCGQVPRFTGQCPKHGDRCPTPSATLPDPWPGYLVEWEEEGSAGCWRAPIERVTLIEGEVRFLVGVNWWTYAPTTIREVRTPDGTTVWKRPAAKVTT